MRRRWSSRELCEVWGIVWFSVRGEESERDGVMRWAVRNGSGVRCVADGVAR